jgi:hypothetical protein
VRTFLITVLASVLVLVTAEVVWGWTFDAAEISFIVLIIDDDNVHNPGR